MNMSIETESQNAKSPTKSATNAATKSATNAANDAATDSSQDPFIVAGRELRSRLIVGTGKYSDNATMVDAIRASGADMVTVAVRRVDLDRTKEEGILHHLNPEEFLLLPNTAGCYTAEDAIRYARLGRAATSQPSVNTQIDPVMQRKRKKRR